MEIGKQIRKYRQANHLSQEELADKVYVTRQTISNWETDKNYPDINSLVLLSTLFQISLDELVKGDLEVMKEQVRQEDIQSFEKESKVFAALMIASIVLLAPLFYYLKWKGIILWGVLYSITLIYSIKIEKKKKEYNIQTYKEIVAFMDGKKLDELDRVKQRAIRPYQKVLLVIISAFMGFSISFIIFYFLG